MVAVAGCCTSTTAAVNRELCVGAQPPDNYKMRGSKQELVATTHKITQIVRILYQ